MAILSFAIGLYISAVYKNDDALSYLSIASLAAATVIAFFRKVQWWLQRGRKEESLLEELEFHLSEEVDQRQTAGLSKNEARLAARRDLGYSAPGEKVFIIKDVRPAPSAPQPPEQK